MRKAIKIESGIPLKQITTNTVYPFEALKKGQSFIAGAYTREFMQKLGRSVAYHNLKNKPKKKFCQRKTDDGFIRVWRTK